MMTLLLRQPHILHHGHRKALCWPNGQEAVPSMPSMPFTRPRPASSRLLELALASCALCCKAQGVYDVPTGALAVIPEGSSRELEDPFTKIRSPPFHALQELEESSI